MQRIKIQPQTGVESRKQSINIWGLVCDDVPTVQWVGEAQGTPCRAGEVVMSENDVEDAKFQGIKKTEENIEGK